MGYVGFFLGVVIGWLATGYIMAISPIGYPCVVKTLFFCTIGSSIPIHIAFSLICGIFMKKALPI